MIVIVVKLGLTVGLLALFGLVWIRRPAVDAFLANQPAGWLVGLWALLRLLPFAVLYGLLNYAATSDLRGFYNGAVAARQGELVYRDFISVYAPLYAYITALPTLLWDDARSLIAFMIGVEGLILWATYRLYRLSPSTVLLYLLLPASLLFCVVGGQEDIWMWGFALLTIKAVQERTKPELWMGVALGLGLVITKALFVLFVPLVFWWVRHKVRLVAGMLLVGLPVLTYLYAVSGLAFLMPVQLAQEPLSPNLWSVLHPFAGGWVRQLPPTVLNFVMLAVLLGITSVYALRWRRQYAGAQAGYAAMIARGWVVVFCLIMLLLPSAYAVYAFGWMLPLLTIPEWRQRRTLRIVLVFNAITAVQPSIWWRLGRPYYTLTDLQHGPYLGEYLLQVSIVGCLVYTLVWLWPRRASRPLPEQLAVH